MVERLERLQGADASGGDIHVHRVREKISRKTVGVTFIRSTLAGPAVPGRKPDPSWRHWLIV